MSTQFTVFFDGQYWVGVLEIVEDQQLRAARHVFGAEPTGPELYEFALHRFAALAAQARKSSAVPIDKAESTLGQGTRNAPPGCWPSSGLPRRSALPPSRRSRKR